MTTEQRVDEALDAVLRASGSALRHHTMPKALAEMRAVMRAIMLAEYIAGAESERAAHNQTTEASQ